MSSETPGVYSTALYSVWGEHSWWRVQEVAVYCTGHCTHTMVPATGTKGCSLADWYLHIIFLHLHKTISDIISGHFISESSRGATSVSAYVRFGHFTKTVRGKFMFLHTFRGLFYIIPGATISLLSVYSVDCTDEPINQCSGPPIPGGCIFLPQIRHCQGRG